MTHLRKSMLALAACSLMAGGTAFAQSQPNLETDKNRQAPGSTPPSVDQPGGANRPPTAAGDTAQPAADRVPGAATPAAGAAPAQFGAEQMAAAQQVDQQIRQEMMKIQQQPQGALDKLFVLESGIGGQFEVAFAQQAQQKSQNPQVKQLAQTIIQDHTQANQQLMRVAQAVGVQLPQGLDSMHAQKLATYGALPSADYDKKFLCVNNELHAKDVEAYKTAAAIAQNPQVKQYAAQTLPKLQMHHKSIMQSGQQQGVVVPGEAMPAGGRVPADHGHGTTPGSGVLIPDRSTGQPGGGTPSGGGTGGSAPR